MRLADLSLHQPSRCSTMRLRVTVGGEKRYQRYYEVIGFAPDLLCGWQEELTSLALPMIVMSRCHPIESRLMIKKLELHLTKLESQKLANHKALRRTKADQQVEAEQVRAVMDALARKKLTIFAVQMVIGIHASDRHGWSNARITCSHTCAICSCVCERSHGGTIPPGRPVYLLTSPG